MRKAAIIGILLFYADLHIWKKAGKEKQEWGMLDKAMESGQHTSGFLKLR